MKKGSKMTKAQRARISNGIRAARMKAKSDKLAAQLKAARRGRRAKTPLAHTPTSNYVAAVWMQNDQPVNEAYDALVLAISRRERGRIFEELSSLLSKEASEA